MRKKWMLKLGVAIFSLTLMGACSSTNNNDDTPQDNNTPKNETPYNDDTDYNKENPDEPGNDVYDDRNQDPSKKDDNGDINDLHHNRQ